MSELPVWPDPSDFGYSEAETNWDAYWHARIEALRTRLERACDMLEEAAYSSQAEMDHDLEEALLRTAQECREPK